MSLHILIHVLIAHVLLMSWLAMYRYTSYKIEYVSVIYRLKILPNKGSNTTMSNHVLLHPINPLNNS